MAIARALLPLALLVLLVPSASAQAPAEPAAASAYLDAGARALVQAARERRRTVDRSVEAYETTAAERISVGLRALRRDRLLWQRDVASRVSWQREGPIRVEVLGAREVVPIAIAKAQVPAALKEYVPHLAFDPADPLLLIGWGGDDIPHPLNQGSEKNYRFRSGDTTTIRLPDGRRVRLLELEVLPRRKEGKLVQGSFWLDADTHALVQATFRLAGDLELEDEDDDDSEINSSLTVDYVTVEYGLWDAKWWLPRVVAARGAMSVGGLASIPVVYERTYRDYEVRGVPGSAAPLALEETEYAPGARVRCPTQVHLQVGGGSEDQAAPADSARPAAPDTTPTDTTAAGAERRARREAQRRACERYEVVLTDTATLLTGDALPPVSFAHGGGLLTEGELSSIREQLEGLSSVPWQLAPLRIVTPLHNPTLLRYNRVEGLSLAARAVLDLGPLEASATARLGLADLEPNGEIALLREGVGPRLRFAAYRRLVAMDAQARPLSLGGSLSALLFGSDEADYFRSLGVELTGEPSLSRARWYEWRLFAQRETAAAKETDFSVPRLFDDGRSFPENDAAQAATQLGGALTLRGVWGRDPLGLRTGAELGLDAAAGTFQYARPSLTLRAGFPLPGPLVGLLEGAGGTSFGEPPLQHLWRVGGPATLRGYASGALQGESFARGRAEVATQFPAGRLILFSDAAWAGSTAGLDTDRWLLSAGAGVSVLDGLVRVDLARALREPTGWRLTAYLDAWQ